MIILGAGSFCPFPYIFNRIYYDTCTRAKVDGTPNTVEKFYWCPSPEDVDRNNDNLFLIDGKYGICHEWNKPPGNQQKMNIKNEKIKVKHLRLKLVNT